MELEWIGKDEKERGIEKSTRKVLVKIDPNYFRPTEVELLIGDAGKAKQQLGWKPKVKFKELVIMMVQSDWEKVQRRGF